MFLTAYGFMFHSILSKNIILIRIWKIDCYKLNIKNYHISGFEGLITKSEEFVLKLRVLKFQIERVCFGTMLVALAKIFIFLKCFFMFLETRNSVPGSCQQSFHLLYPIKTYPPSLTLSQT